MPKELSLDIESKTEWLSEVRVVHLDKPDMKCDVTLKLKFQGEKKSEGDAAHLVIQEELYEFLRETNETLSNQFTALDFKVGNASSLQVAQSLVDAFQSAKLNVLKAQLPGKVDTALKKCASEKAVKALEGVKIGKCKCTLNVPTIELTSKAKKQFASVKLPETAPVQVRKGKFGPRTYNLLTGIGSYSDLDLPDACNVTIEVNYELESDEIITMAELGDACTEYIDTLKTTLKKALVKTNASIAKTKESGDIDTARAQMAQLKKELAMLELDAQRNGKKVILKAVKDIADREVDVIVNKAEATVKCVFAVIKIGTAAEELFSKPPGWNLISPLLRVVGGIATIITTLKEQLSDAITLRDNLNDGLIDLEEARSLAAKKWAEMSKKEVAIELKDKVYEIAFGQIEGLEVTLKTFGAKVTWIDNASKLLAKNLNQLLEQQDQLEQEHAEEIANRIAPLIDNVIGMREQMNTLRKEEAAFEKTLKNAKANTDKVVQLGVTLMAASELLKPVGVAELACNVVIREAGTYAKKRRKF